MSRARPTSFAIFHARELGWAPRGKRHADKAQEEVFVVMEGTLTVDLGEPPERHELERGSILVGQPGTILQLRNAGTTDLVPFINGAPPLAEGADFHPDVPWPRQGTHRFSVRSSTTEPLSIGYSRGGPARRAPPTCRRILSGVRAADDREAVA